MCDHKKQSYFDFVLYFGDINVILKYLLSTI
jgi:hypothetical protein